MGSADTVVEYTSDCIYVCTYVCTHDTKNRYGSRAGLYGHNASVTQSNFATASYLKLQHTVMYINISSVSSYEYLIRKFVDITPF